MKANTHFILKPLFLGWGLVLLAVNVGCPGEVPSNSFYDFSLGQDQTIKPLNDHGSLTDFSDSFIPAKECDNGNPCYSGGKDPDTGECVFKPKPQNSICDDKNSCTYDDICDANAVCKGVEIKCENDKTTCGPQRSCNGTAKCAEVFPDATKVCSAGCMKDGHCNGKGTCAGGTPVSCTNDKCHTRTCDPNQGKCIPIQSFGQSVFKEEFKDFHNNVTYKYNTNGAGTVAFRILKGDFTLHQLLATNLNVYMLSQDPTEANYCSWCNCINGPDWCVFHDTGVDIFTDSTQQAGQVRITRYHNDVSQLSWYQPPDANWIPNGTQSFQGWVCPLE